VSARLCDTNLVYAAVVPTGPDGTITQAQLDQAAAAAAGGPVMGLFGPTPDLLLDPLTGNPLDDQHDYMQTTTITEVPSMAPGMHGSSGGGAAAAAAAAGGRVPIAAGTTVFGPGGSSSGGGLAAQLGSAPVPGVVIRESPMAAMATAGAAAAAADLAATAAAAAAAGPSSSTGVGLQQQPRVDSPQEAYDMGIQDLLSDLNATNSGQLMLTDDSAKEDVWEMLFGRSSSGVMSPGLGDAAAAGGSSAPMAVPGMGPGAHGVDLDGPVAMNVGSPGLGLGLDPAVAAAAAPRHL
jgi:hypothetical protein